MIVQSEVPSSPPPQSASAQPVLVISSRLSPVPLITNQTLKESNIINTPTPALPPHPPPKLNDLNCKLKDLSVKLPPLTVSSNTSSSSTSPIILNISSIAPISKTQQPTKTASLSDSNSDSLTEDSKETPVATIPDDHYYCRHQSESVAPKPEVSETPPEVSPQSPTSPAVLIKSVPLSAHLSSPVITLPVSSPAEPETDIKRFFLQRHPDGRLLLVPLESIITAVQTPPEVSADTASLPRSPLFRIALADSSSAFPVPAELQVVEQPPTSPLVITATIFPTTLPPQPEVAADTPSVPTSSLSTSSPQAVSLKATPTLTLSPSSSPSDSQTSTMTSYVFSATASATGSCGLSPTVQQQQQIQQQPQQQQSQNSPLPPVETIFSVSDSHAHHQNHHHHHNHHHHPHHLAQSHPQNIPQNTNHMMMQHGRNNNNRQQFDEFEPLFSDMSEQHFTHPTTVINDHHIDYYSHVDSTTTLIEDDDDDELLSASKCLPFGYFYDDQKMFNKLEMISSSLPSSTTSSSSPLLDALELNDLFTATPPGPQHQQAQQQQPHHPHHQQHLQSGLSHPLGAIKHEFSSTGSSNNNSNSEQFQMFHTSNYNSSSNGYGMAGYGQDPLISGRLSKTTSSSPEQIKMELKTEDDDDEMLAMMGWTEPLNGGQHFGTHGDGQLIGLNQQHNTISSTSSPTVVSEFWPNGAPLQSPTIATTSSSSTAGQVTDGQIFEDLLVPDLDDGSLEIENILSSQNQMFGSPPKLSNCLIKDELQNQNFARPAFVRQQGQQQPHPGANGQPQHQTVLGELLLRDNASITASITPLVNGQPPANASILVQLPPNHPHHSKLGPLGPTATIHHRPQHPTPLQQARSMQNNCPTLAALITRAPGPQDASSRGQQGHAQAQPIPIVGHHSHMGPTTTLAGGPGNHQLNQLIANEMALHGNARNRNNSMSTDYSISSHDEGFASQQEDGSESDESAILSLPPEPDTMEGEMFYMNISSNGPGSSSQPIAIHGHQHQQQLQYMFQQPSTSFDESELMHHNGNGSVSDEDDDEEDDDDDESFYGDYNAEDLLGATTSDDVNNKWSLNMGRSRKGNEKRFFWQYNVQSKGPKAPKYTHTVSSLDIDSEDPHIFKETADPVFSEDCHIEGVKHSGKARRGDGNDLTPNPKKLLMIGLELKKLSKIINDLTPVTDVPAPSRDKTRKEKNKLASRACRLKKKAQHEANKIKLHGLHREHSKLMRTISDIRKIIQWSIRARDAGNKTSTTLQLTGNMACHVSLTTDVQALVAETVGRSQPHFHVSSHTADFVNHVLDNVSAGVANGGIDEV